MSARNGKIAHLPNHVREQLNLRLLDGETGRELAAWLNALPEVQSVLGSQFNGAPVSEVNLTHWRQGGYLQWLTERECFDSARALAEGDGDLAKTGLSADRLFNILTLRFGQLLTQWDLPPDEGVSEAAVWSQMARKARILLGINRAVLAIHRLQSQPASKKSEPSMSFASSRASSEAQASPSSESAQSLIPRLREKKPAPATAEPLTVAPKDNRRALEMPTPNPFRALLSRAAGCPKILSGPITPPSILFGLPRTQFEPEPSLSEILNAV